MPPAAAVLAKRVKGLVMMSIGGRGLDCRLVGNGNVASVALVSLQQDTRPSKY